MNVVVQPSDVAKALHTVGAFKDPVGIAGKVVGLGRDEVNAGIPAWAFCVAALAAGVYIGGKYGRDLPLLREIF